MHLSSRTVLGSGQKKIAIHGPFPEIEEELVALHLDFWPRKWLDAALAVRRLAMIK